jgi:succinyl-CoA synthetase beta subunit
MALDAKIVIDESGIFKHDTLETFRNREEYGPDELEAKGWGLSFINMEGNIGCIVNGAGLAMATMDIIKLFGGVPANFLDVGGSSSPEKVLHAFEIISHNSGVKAILINIFGGITRCDDIAKGILQAKKQMDLSVPLVIRLIGTNEKEGRALLEKDGIVAYEDLVKAVEKVVKFV